MGGFVTDSTGRILSRAFWFRLQNLSALAGLLAGLAALLAWLAVEFHPAAKPATQGDIEGLQKQLREAVGLLQTQKREAERVNDLVEKIYSDYKKLESSRADRLPQANEVVRPPAKRTVKVVEEEILARDVQLVNVNRRMSDLDKVLKSWAVTTESYSKFSKASGDVFVACALIQERLNAQSGEHPIVVEVLQKQANDCAKSVAETKLKLLESRKKIDEVQAAIAPLKQEFSSLGLRKDEILKEKKALESEKLLMQKLSFE